MSHPKDPLEAQSWSAKMMRHARYETSVFAIVAGILIILFGSEFKVSGLGYVCLVYGVPTTAGLYARRWDRVDK
jgi:hypothetical protein